MDINPFEYEPTDDDLAMGDVILVNNCGDPVGVDIRIDEDPWFETNDLPEFVDGVDFPDEWYDTLADWTTSGTY